MTKHLLDRDRSMYDLRSLRLDVIEVEETSHSNSLKYATRTFKVIGKGGFGSVYVGTIRKAPFSTIYQAVDYHQILGYYHGAMLAVHATNEHSLKAVRQGSVIDSMPIKVAVKRIEAMAVDEYELIREASNLKVLWGRRNFVTMYGPARCQDLGCVCLVMDYVPGCNLNKFLQSRGTALFGLDGDETGRRMCNVWQSNEILWWMEKLKLFREIVIALIVCHSQKVYHGDLKGANILLDRSLVPKMVDFGLSFRRTDISYLRSVGGSLFWSAPEVSCDPPDADKIYESDVVSDPYPSDVYSLGMVLAEMMLDGKIKESLTDVEYFLADKLEDGCPVSLDHVRSQDALFTRRILGGLKNLTDRCCKAERIERISLQECLLKVNSIYSEMFSFCCPSLCSRLYDKTDHVFTETPAYKDMALRFNGRFRQVPECIVVSPSWNMHIDEEDNHLVHYFCKLDYAEGVKFILETDAWGFQAERDIPHLALLCVMDESVQTLRYLAASWPDIMEKQVFLPHRACLCNSCEIFQILLDLKIDCDTWEAEYIGQKPRGGWGYSMKPIHKLAASGKTEMVRMILESCEDPDYVNTTTFTSEKKTPLYFAIDSGDNVETVRLLVERGGIMYEEVLMTHLRRSCDDWEGVDYDIGWLLDDLRSRAESLGHDGILEFLNGMSPSSAMASFQRNCKVESGEIEGEKEEWEDLKEEWEERAAVASYVNKILADFETGASEEIISLHFHIEFPEKLAGACCEKGYLGILQFLGEYCELGLNPVYRKYQNFILDDAHLLHTAASFGHVNIVQFLLQRGYPVDSSAFLTSASPLQWVCASKLEPNRKHEMAGLLLDAGADPNHRDIAGYTAMWIVCGGAEKGSRDLIRLLLEAGFDCGQKDRWGEDYMEIIAQMGSKKPDVAIDQTAQILEMEPSTWVVSELNKWEMLDEL